uniref:Uncharacterized protein n=1 Tax=viral metagenome TaxID=1070528 RepID=A0A6C0BMW8_9ZZZZ
MEQLLSTWLLRDVQDLVLDYASSPDLKFPQGYIDLKLRHIVKLSRKRKREDLKVPPQLAAEMGRLLYPRDDHKGLIICGNNQQLANFVHVLCKLNPNITDDTSTKEVCWVRVNDQLPSWHLTRDPKTWINIVDGEPILLYKRYCPAELTTVPDGVQPILFIKSIHNSCIQRRTRAIITTLPDLRRTNMFNLACCCLRKFWALMDTNLPHEPH